jgi:hypothetical protein
LNIEGKRVLVLGGFGLVGRAVCRELLPHNPGDLIVSSLYKEQSQKAIRELQAEFSGNGTRYLPAWGDILLRSDWQEDAPELHPRQKIMADPNLRRQLVADLLEELNEDIVTSSLLYRQVTGAFPGLDGKPVDIVIDCVNTATAVAYQNVYKAASRLEGLIERGEHTDWPFEVERLLTSLYVPQLVRHMQILYESMQRAGTQAYVKVGTSGTGGMGFNIPYTHGEERPSRVLLSKSAIAGAQSMLIFLMARTPNGPPIVKEVKPTAAIAWKEIGFGEVRRRGGLNFRLYDCPIEGAYSLEEAESLADQGEFGVDMGATLQSVFIDTGENGLFAVGEFTALTSLGQMEFITPEEIATTVVAEITGSSTGREIVGALDGAVMGPSYRAGAMREAALTRLHQLEEEHGVDSIAFEMLGPPRLSKLLFEAYLLKRAFGTPQAVVGVDPEVASEELLRIIKGNDGLRQRILSIGLPILLPSGDKLLRGPEIKSQDAEHGWVDLRPENLERWQARLKRLLDDVALALASGTSSQIDRGYPSLAQWDEGGSFDVGEIVGWIFNTEEGGRRTKS